MFLTGGINSQYRELFYMGLILITILGGKKLGIYSLVGSILGCLIITYFNTGTINHGSIFYWFTGVSLLTVYMVNRLKVLMDRNVLEYIKQNQELTKNHGEIEVLLKQVQNQADEVRLFYQMSLELAACQDQEQLSQCLINWAERVNDCNWVALYTLEDNKVTLKNSSKDSFERSKSFLLNGGEQFILRLLSSNIPLMDNTPKYNILLRNKTILGDLKIHSIAAVPITIKGKNNGVMVLFNERDPFTEEHMKKLVSIANHSAMVLEVAILHSEKTALFYQTLTSLAAAIDAKDSYTKGHSEKVTYYAGLIGKELGLSPKQMESLKYASLLHDIGKIGIPDAVLNKPGKLNDEEFAIIKKHPNLSYYIVKDIDFLNDTLDGIRYHHERMDGRGYPAI